MTCRERRVTGIGETRFHRSDRNRAGVPIQTAQAQRLAHVRDLQPLCSREIRNTARELDAAMACTRGQAELARRALEQRGRLVLDRAPAAQLTRLEPRIEAARPF